MGERKIKVHIMHSMKGGCGKSACALFKAMQIAVKSEINNRKASVILIDADFKGSAMQKLLFGDTKVEENSYQKLIEGHSGHVVRGKGVVHRLAIPNGYSENKNLNRFLKDKNLTFVEILNRSFSYDTTPSNVEEGPSSEEFKINGFLDFVFSASSNEDKELFKRGAQEALAIGIYTYRMSVFLRQVLEYGKVPGEEGGQYSDLVIDMPPGYDEYSDLILEELRRLAAGKKNIELHYYAVTTNDLGHIHLTKNNVTNKVKKDTYHKPWDSVNVVLSCMRKNDFEINDGKMQEVNNDVLKLCELVSKGEKKGKIYKCNYEDNYYKFCRSYVIGEFGCPVEFEEISVNDGRLQYR